MDNRQKTFWEKEWLGEGCLFRNPGALKSPSNNLQQRVATYWKEQGMHLWSFGQSAEAGLSQSGSGEWHRD